MHHLLAPADYRRMPWKNGGGHTLEIATHPADADLASFAWRVSIADVTRDGPFSAFPGVERTLVLLAGRGMRLVGAGDPMDLMTPFEPVTFAGEASLHCTLSDGPTRDFNLMVRRASASGEVVVVRDESLALPPAQTYVCFAAAGACECLIAGFPPLEVSPEHTLICHAEGGGGMHVSPTSANAVALVVLIGRQNAAGVQ